MQPILPFWFKQRQGKIEAAGTDAYKLIAPNSPEACIGIQRGDNGRWLAFLRTSADGPEKERTEAQFETQGEAWEAAFELYREAVVT